MITSIADTSFVIAVANQFDPRHKRCLEIYELQDEICLLQSAFAEIAYLLTREGGNRLMVRFLESLPDTRYVLSPIVTEDIFRITVLLRQYADSRLDFVDASVIAAAERLNITRVLTLDQRDFRIVRPRHTPSLELLP